VPQDVAPNPLRRTPDSSTAPTMRATDTMRAGKCGRGGVAVRVGVSSYPSPTHAHAVGSNAAFATPSCVGGDASSSASAAAAYTGAAILSCYANRRKLLQKASALSSQMHKQVTDVVQMEEEQRLLTQAHRSRQKLAEQEREQAHAQQKKQLQQQKQQHQQQRPGEDLTTSPTQEELHVPAEGDNRVYSVANADGEQLPHSAGAAGADGYGVVLGGAPDIKRMLQQQAYEKNETLGKMRGMQLAIQELSAAAAAEEERWLARPRFANETGTSTAGHTCGEGDEGGVAHAIDDTNRGTNAPQSCLSPDVVSKLDAVCDLRIALKDMLDARLPRTTDRGTYSGGGSGGAGGATFSNDAGGGTTWIEQDAVYNPPAPPQVFSTNALAVTLEYVSDSMASIVRIADEFCIATTFRAREEQLSLLPHLRSLAKWTAQAERSLAMAQRHLRHFNIGETAVVDGGAYEVNSLREQTLLLKETLTAQDQKVKATEEAKAAVLHRLREIRQRCRMWESYLLHRTTESEKGDRSLESPFFYSLGNARTNQSTAFLNTHSNSNAAQLAAHSVDATITTFGAAAERAATTSSCGVDGAANTTESSPPSAFLVPAGKSGAECSTNGSSNWNSGSARPIQPSTQQPSVEPSGDASPPPRPPQPAVLHNFLPFASAVATSGPASAPTAMTAASTLPGSTLTPSTMDRMERRIARSWGNPYIRKRLLRQRAEAAAAAAASKQQAEREMESFLSLSQRPPLAECEIGGEAVSAIPHSISPTYDHLQGDAIVADTAAQGFGASPLAASVSLDRPLSSPPATTVLVDSGAPHRLPRVSQEEKTRRCWVSVTSPSPRTPLPAFGEVSDGLRGGRAFGSAASAASALTGLGEVDTAEVADARAMQLLLSLLRSVPSSVALARQGVHQAGSSGDGDDTGSGGPDPAAHSGGPSREAPPGVSNVLLDEAVRDSSRHSMQRLIQFLKAQTKQSTPNQLPVPQR
jgi:23S rRNA maturation mini-RNase III